MARRSANTCSRGRADLGAADTGATRRTPTGTPTGSRATPDGSCALCQRVVDRITVHHLVPRARGGNHGPTARLCPTCHRQLHAMFSVATLAEELHSIELLRANPRVAGFLRWMRKQLGTSFPVRRARQKE